VDKMIFSFTHTQETPWMLPGVAPTNRRVEVPLVAVVGFREGKLPTSEFTGTKVRS
jgi:carboxymethylenebutenolidase